jgi:YHS domain-containing protein
MMRKLSLLLPLVAALAFGCKAGNENTPMIKANATCPVSGKAVDSASFYEYEGTKIYTCCDKCIDKIKADPATAMAKAYPK